MRNEVARPVDQALDEFFTYLRNYGLGKLLGNKHYTELVKSIYRRYHALLVWQTNLAEGELWPGQEKKDNEFRLYFNESVSDLCQSFLLLCHGMYKPSNIVLRSGIEAFVKSVGLAEDQKVLSLTSLFEVFEVVSHTNIAISVPLVARAVQTLHNDYADLCKYVHIAGPPYMSLLSVAGAFPKFDTQSKDSNKRIRSAIVAICSIVGVIFNARFKDMHHTSIDLISDILPVQARRRIMSFEP
jgi:hypothetical protein